MECKTITIEGKGGEQPEEKGFLGTGLSKGQVLAAGAGVATAASYLAKRSQ